MMHTEIKIPRWKYYGSAIILGSMVNLSLLILTLFYFGIKGKSLISLYYVSIQGYFTKSLLFYLPWFFLGNGLVLKTQKLRDFMLFLPFFLFLMWFGFIILFKIWSMSHEISYGYLDRFPHFYTQLMTALLFCVFVRYRVMKRMR